MTKTGIWAIIVATAFIAGTLMANPVADAAGGWKEAIDNLGQTLGLTDSCADGEVLKWNSATSSWDCSPDDSGSGVASDVVCTDCVDTTDIADGTITSTDIADGTVTSADIADGAILASDLGDSLCADGQVLKWNDAVGIWGCATDADTIYTDADAISAVEGTTLSSITTSGDYSYDTLQLRSVVVNSVRFTPLTDVDADNSNVFGIGKYVKSTSVSGLGLVAPVDIPNDARIISVDCYVLDRSSTQDAECGLLSYGSGFAPNGHGIVSTSGLNGLIQTLHLDFTSGSLFKHPLNDYYVHFKPTDKSCDIDCRIFKATVNYVVSKAD